MVIKDSKGNFLTNLCGWFFTWRESLAHEFPNEESAKIQIVFLEKKYGHIDYEVETS